jgi:hypothetical protein
MNTPCQLHFNQSNGSMPLYGCLPWSKSADVLNAWQVFGQIVDF